MRLRIRRTGKKSYVVLLTLCRFVNFYNNVKPHKSLKGDTPFEVLQASFPTCCVNNPTISYTL
ncbi:hypothetical protein E4T99_08290 [Neisseria sp. WF04]|nr:hypothetical protein E4T99_08290 [Neisseria sp. WF04]